MNPQIEVQGLKELNRALRQVDADLPKQLKGKFFTIATSVASVVRGRLPQISGLLASSTDPYATTKGAGIRWKGEAAEYAAQVEFGGYPGEREYVASGRYVFASVDARRSEIEAEVEKVLDDILTEAGLT